MFAPSSRYAGLVTYTLTRPDGSTVIATRLPLPNPLRLRQIHEQSVRHRYGGTAASNCDADIVELEVEENADLPSAFSVSLPVNTTSSGDYDTISDPRLAPRRTSR